MASETPWQALDLLSPAARAAAEANAGSAYTQLVTHGEGWPGAKELLSPLSQDTVLAGPVHSREDAELLLAGLWLVHDCLEASHRISQKVGSLSGNFWHAIMHRREGDFPNAKYWYARCRNHPILEQIPAIARSALGDAATTSGPLHRLVEGAWDPDAFVDVVEAIHRKPGDPMYGTAVRLQQLEWRALFSHCASKAAGIK